MSIVEFLDSRFGDNINNLKELNKIYTNAQEKKAELIKKVGKLIFICCEYFKPLA